MLKERMSSIKNSQQRFHFEEQEENGDHDDMYDFIDRPTSAPPNLEVYENMNRNNILNMEYREDLRYHPKYEKFYMQYGDPSLPPPFPMIDNMVMYNNNHKENEYSLFGNNGRNNISEEHNPNVSKNENGSEFQGYNMRNKNIPLQYLKNVDGYVYSIQDGSNIEGNNGNRMNPSNFGNSFFAPGGPISQSNHTNDKSSGMWNKDMPSKSKSINMPKNKNIGKVVINSDTNLSSSTEDLLSLAGKTHLKANTSRDDITNSIKELRISGKNVTPIVPPIQLSKIQPETENPAPSSSRSSVCRYFSQGFCSKGSKCSFMHPGEKTEKLEDIRSSSTQVTPRKTPRNPLISPSKYATMTIDDCINNICNMCRDQYGCRFLQKKLDEDKTTRTCDIIFKEVLNEFSELMSDPFGNYLCQKLIEKCSIEQRTDLVKSVSKNLVKISKNIHGTRAVQKTIEQVSSKEEIKLIRDALKGNVVALIQDLNGNHVIQKCIHKLEPNDNQFIYDAVAQHCVQVATHRHGCCVMQRCIDHSSSQQQMQLVEEIKNNALELVQDAFGNYVVQYVLDLGYENVCQQIAEKLVDSLYYLATQKFSSNVVEKCFKVGNEKTVKLLTRQLANFRFDGEQASQDPLIELLQHPFGNYVVQTALLVSSVKAVEEWSVISERIKLQIHNLKSTPYVKRIQTLILNQEKLSEQNM